jgi:hypothetical protein
MLKLDAKTKGIIRKDRFGTCGYIYRDGIAIRYEERHTFKGEEFTKHHTVIVPGEIPIYMHNQNGEGPFKGRIVVHNSTLLLDGIEAIEIYRNTGSENSKKMCLHLDGLTLVTGSGMRIHENIFDFISSDYCIQNEKSSSVKDWETPDV